MQKCQGGGQLQKGFPPDRTYVRDQELSVEGARGCSGVEGLLIEGSCPPEFKLGTEVYRAFMIEDYPMRVSLYKREDIGIEESRNAAENCVGELVRRLEERGYVVQTRDMKLEKIIG